MKRCAVIRALTLAGLVLFSGFAYVAWLRAPVIDTFGLQAWRAIGIVGAASISGIGVLSTRSWVRASVAVSIGFLTGAAWSEFWLNDVTTGPIDSVVAAVMNQGPPFLLPWVAAALAGAVATRAVSGHR